MAASGELTMAVDMNAPLLQGKGFTLVESPLPHKNGVSG